MGLRNLADNQTIFSRLILDEGIAIKSFSKIGMHNDLFRRQP
jgi:hypothetical protein